jgi:hypothetical protein
MIMDTPPDLTDPVAEKGVASTLSTMMPAGTATKATALAVAKGGIDMGMDVNDNGIPNTHNEDAEQVAFWATRQLTSPVHLQSLRIVYDTLVDRQHHNQTSSEQQHDERKQINFLIRALRLTCCLLLEIHRECESTVHQQQLLTTSQQHCIETTEQRCSWLLEHMTGKDNPDDKDHAADDPNRLPVGSDSSGGVITNLCCRPAVNESSGHTEWTYDYNVAAKDDDNSSNRLQARADDQEHDDANENDNNGDDDGGGNMLPSRAELAAEERMLWRMADTPIPSETLYGGIPVPSTHDQQS